MENKTQTIPFFPLCITILPGEEVQLHVFESHFIELIRDANNEGFTFGIPYVKGFNIEGYGTEVYIKDILRIGANGTMDVTVVGVSVFKVLNYTASLSNKPYCGGEVETINQDYAVEDAELLAAFKVFNDYVSETSLSYTYIHPITVFDIGEALNLSNKIKYDLISCEDIDIQEILLMQHLRYVLLILDQEARTENDIYLN